MAWISGYPPFYSINLLTSVPKFFETTSSRWIYEDSPLSIIGSLSLCIPGAKERCRILFPSLAWNVGAIRYWSLPVTRLEKRTCRNHPGSESVPNSDRWRKARLYATENFWKGGRISNRAEEVGWVVDCWSGVRLEVSRFEIYCANILAIFERRELPEIYQYRSSFESVIRIMRNLASCLPTYRSILYINHPLGGFKSPCLQYLHIFF